MNTARSNLLRLYGGWALLFVVCGLAYWPGLAGPFVFDDFGTIAALGDLGGVTDWNTFKAFVFGGHAGPTGRPVSLLTFVFDARDWPADPWPFKRSNLVIHLANGALLGLLCQRILRTLGTDADKARWAALVAAGAWLLHPFLVSTTLYVAQRMAQLSTLFVFIGLLVYLRGRSLVATNALHGYVVMTLGIGAFTILAVLSKESGALLPLLVGVAEITVVASQRDRMGKLNRAWVAAFLWLPVIVVVAYLGLRVSRTGFFEVVANRDFSIYERVLTQSRVLFDYLKHWFVPELYTTGVFQDHIIVSRGLLAPWTTLASGLFHTVAIALLFVTRRRWPLLAFAGLFFYASHVLESTVLNLEMYFEHRNYVAAAFLFLPLVTLLQNKVKPAAFGMVAVAVLVMLAGFTQYSATIWSDYDAMVSASARKAPTSARAQQQFATNLFNERRFDEALFVIDRAIATMPDRTELLVTRSIMLCDLGSLTASDFSATADVLSSGYYDVRSLEFYSNLAGRITSGACPQVDANDLRQLFDRMVAHPRNSDPSMPGYSQLLFLRGFADIYRNEPDEAVQSFEASLQSRPGAGQAMQMASLLAANAYYDQALHMSGIALAELDRTELGALDADRIKRADIEHFRQSVREEMNAGSSGD